MARFIFPPFNQNYYLVFTVDKTITLPLSDAAKEDVDKNNTPKVEDSNPFESNEKPMVEDKEDKEAAKGEQEATNEDDPKNQDKTKKKKKCSKCCCCIS